MADDPNPAAGTVANALEMPGAPPTPAAPPPMSYEAAVSRKAELIGDAEFRKLLLNGDVGANAEWKRVIAGLTYNDAPAPADPTSHNEAVDWLQERYGLSEDVAAETRAHQPISSALRRQVELKKAALFRDQDWVRRLNAGDQQANREMGALISLLSRRVSDKPE